MTQVKDYAIVTFAETDNDKYLHAYGPYTKREAMRIANQLSRGNTWAVARKLLNESEVTAKPANPRGY